MTRRPILLAATALLLAIACSGCETTDVRFSPDGGCAELIAEEIDASSSSVHVAVYTFTSTDLRDRLTHAHLRGVEVQVVLDPWETNESAYAALDADGVPVRYAENPHGGIMHHKFAVIDERVVLTGSYNWTDSAENVNDENLVRLTNPQVALRYEDVFTELWQRGD